MPRSGGAVVAILAAVWTVAAAAEPSLVAAKHDCATLVPPEGVQLSSAKVVAATSDAPEHCEIVGTINPHHGAATNQDYAIRFHLRMPAQSWRQRFLFVAQGGNDGNLGDALGGSPGSPNALSQGFAVVSTDSGHDNATNSVAGDGEQANFGLDPQARLDYGYHADDAVTQAAKRLISLYYGVAPYRSYLNGCSNGGRHGMVDAVRMPDAFDGILVGDPGFDLPQAAVAEAWDNQAFAAVATAKDIKGQPALWTAFSDTDLKTVSEEIRKQCDALDGLADGMVDDWQACQKKMDITALRCASEKTASCLTAAQVDALKKVMGGARDTAGHALYTSWPWDVGIGAPGWRAWKLGTGLANARAGMPANLNNALNATLAATSLPYVFITPPVRGPGYFAYTLAFDFDKDAPKIFAHDGVYGASAVDFMSATTDVGPFLHHGGKIILYHGVSDPVFSINDTVRWYEAVAGNNGGMPALQKSARLFAIPGMNHCGGGPATDQFDGLAALVAWVEDGKAPDRIVAKASSQAAALLPAGRSRPLCPFPAHAHYNGTGSIDDAANFTCR